jgi:hypothetical protein
MAKRHSDRVEELENVLTAETGIKIRKGSKIVSASPPAPMAPPSGQSRQAADTSDYDCNAPYNFPLVGNGLGATVWPDRQQGLDKLYETLKMSAVRLWVQYGFDDNHPPVPSCGDTTRGNMDNYWMGFNGELAARSVSAARQAQDNGAETTIVIKYPPEPWRFSVGDNKWKLSDSNECRRAVAIWWGAAVKRFIDLGMQFKRIELFNEPNCVCSPGFFRLAKTLKG